MATQEAKIIVKMQAETGRLQASLDRSEKKLKRFEGQTKKSVANVNKTFKTMGVAVGIGIAATVVLVNKTRAAIDAQAKFADSIGISTEALAGLEQAAAINGASQEGLRKGLERLVVNLNDFKGGIGEAVDSFERLGISIEDIKDKSPDEVFALVGDRLKTIPSQAERAALAYEIFGKQGIKLIKTLETGSEGLKGFQEEAKALGLSLSRVDAAQVEAANDALQRAGAVSEGFAKQLTVALSPSITAVANLYREAAIEAGGMGDAATAAGKFSVLAIGSIGDTIEDISIGLKESKGQFADFVAFVIQVSQQLNVFGLSEKLFGISAAEVTTAIENWRSVGDDAASAFEKAVADRLKNGTFSEQLIAQMEKDRAKIEAALASSGGGKSSSVGGVSVGGGKKPKKEKDPLASSLSEVKNLLESLQSPLENYNNSIAELEVLTSNNRIGQEQYNLAAAEYKRILEEATPGIDNMQELTQALADTLPAEEAALAAVRQQMLDLNLAMELFPDKADAITSSLINLQEEEARLIEKSKETGDGLTEFGKEAARNIQNELGTTLRDTLSGDFDGILDSWGNMLAEMGVQLLAQSFADSFNLEEMFSSGGGGGGGGIASFFGGFFADGGRPPMGKASMIGENGPELFVPDSAGTIVPNHELGGGQQFSFGNVVLNGVTNQAEATKAAGKFMNETARLMGNAQRYT